MNNNEDVIIGNYKITASTVSECWTENWGIRGNDKSKVIGFARIDTRKKETWLQRIALRKLPLIEFIEGLAKKEPGQYIYTISDVSGYVPHESEYTIGTWIGSEEDLVEFYTKEMQKQREAEIKKQNDFALFCLNNPLPRPPRG